MSTLLILHRLSILAGFFLAHLAVAGDWNQWRGPGRDGMLSATNWPATLEEESLRSVWRRELGPGYSGPVLLGNHVFITESKNDTEEHVYALDRLTGEIVWHAQWEGFVKVPFFARKNGNWIRSTPAVDRDRLYVAGMRDRLVCLDARDGTILWNRDFVTELGTPVPDFGFASSPLPVGDAVYVQAAAALVKLDRETGRIQWRTLQDEGGMWGSAFSSPMFARIAGQDQLVVQTREKLAGIHPDSGAVLWETPVKAFRGMNILTPLIRDNRIFTTAYGGKAHQFVINRNQDGFTVTEAWSAKAEGYMSSPVLVEGHIYLHLRNQRFACVDWNSGMLNWESEEKFGNYWSLVSNGHRILALDEDGTLRLIRADPEQFLVESSRVITKEEAWAHLAVAGDQLLVRDLKGITAFRWTTGADPLSSQ